MEKQIVHQPKLAPLQKALRDSLLDVGVSPFNGFTYDHISGTKIGGTIFDRFGRRHTSAELLASADPKKITVLIYATVQKIIFDTSGIHDDKFDEENSQCLVIKFCNVSYRKAAKGSGSSIQGRKW